jgi:hypothetical protein
MDMVTPLLALAMQLGLGLLRRLPVQGQAAMTALSDLIAKLEAAAEGSRELDARIHVAVVNPAVMTDPGGYRGERPVKYELAQDVFADRGADFSDAADLLGAPHYTTSLDAALPGENIVKVARLPHGKEGWMWVALHNPSTGASLAGFGFTEALARRGAALKAREKQP